MYDSFIWYSYIFIYYCESMHLFYRHVYCLPYRAEGVEIKLLDVICVKTSGSHGPLIFFHTFYGMSVHKSYHYLLYRKLLLFLYIKSTYHPVIYGGGHASTHIFFFIRNLLSDEPSVSYQNWQFWALKVSY